MSPKDRPLAWLHGDVKTPPFSKAARIHAGYLLRLLQRGETLSSMPESRPMPDVGPRCHELRIDDQNVTWRIVYRIDPDAGGDCRRFQEEDREDAETGSGSLPTTLEGV